MSNTVSKTNIKKKKIAAVCGSHEIHPLDFGVSGESTSSRPCVGSEPTGLLQWRNRSEERQKESRDEIKGLIVAVKRQL